LYTFASNFITDMNLLIYAVLVAGIKILSIDHPWMMWYTSWVSWCPSLLGMMNQWSIPQKVIYC